MAGATSEELRKPRRFHGVTIAVGFALFAAGGCAMPSKDPAPAVSHPYQPSFATASSDSTHSIQPAAYQLTPRADDTPAEPPELGLENAPADDYELQQLPTPNMIEPEAERIDRSFDLSSLISTALASHPRIAAARQHVAAVSNRIPQATSLPDPVFNNTFWPIHDHALQTAGGRVGNQMALNQTVPWPAKLESRGAIARREVQVAEAEVAIAESEIAESVRLAYYELWLADTLIGIVEDNKELVGDLVTVAEARYRAGGSQQDILRAELEGDKLDHQLIVLRRQREQALADLGTLIRQPLGSMPVAVDELDVDEVAPSLDRIVANAEQCNPMLQGLAAQIARDREKESLACLQRYPNLQFGLGWWLISDNADVISRVANGHDNVSFTVGVTLPVYREKINAAIREAAHERSSTINRHEAERDRLRGALRRQVAAAYAAIEQLNLFRDRLIPRTEQTLEIAVADYQGQKTDFFNLVDIYQELLAYQVQLARIKATLAGTLARIERTVGC